MSTHYHLPNGKENRGGGKHFFTNMECLTAYFPVREIMFVENIENSRLQFPVRESMFVENIENRHLHFPVREIII